MDKKQKNKNKLKIKEFLKTNLETLQGQDLQDFMEKYELRTADRTEMMLLDMGYPDQFVAFRSSKEDTYFVASYEMVEKILFLEPMSE